MKNKFVTSLVKGLIGLIVICLLGLLLYRDHWRENNKNVFEFPSSIQIDNVSGVEYLDTIAALAVYKILEYDTINIVIAKTSLQMGPKDMELHGFIEKDPYKPHTYFIYVNPKYVTKRHVGFISHEIIHLDQMESGRMTTIAGFPGKVFDGDTINYYEVLYEDRPFEKDAVKRGFQMEVKLRALIYKKFIW